MNTEEKVYVEFPTDNKYNQDSDEMSRIPREFNVTVQFSMTATVKVLAATLEEAEDMAGFRGRGQWPARKDWEDGGGDNDVRKDIDEDDEANQNISLRIVGVI